MKQKIKRALCLLLCLTLIALLLTGCGEKNAVKSRISDFESAIRKGNIEAMLECYEPSVSSTLQGALSLFGLDSASVSSFLQMMGLSVADEDEAAGLLATLKITPQSYEFSADKSSCKVTAIISYTLFGEEYQEDGTINCVEVDGKWYIE